MQHGFIAQEVKTAIDADSGIQDVFKLWDERVMVSTNTNGH